MKLIFNKKSLELILFSLFFIFQSRECLASGKINSKVNAPSFSGWEVGLSKDVKEKLEKLNRNSYLQALSRQFKKSSPPLMNNHTKGDISFDDRALLGITFECKEFSIFSGKEHLSPALDGKFIFSDGSTGPHFRLKLSKDSDVKYFSFYDMTGSRAYEVIGSDETNTFYEKIRMMKNGDLIIERSVAEELWIESILALLKIKNQNIDKYKPEIEKILEPLKRKTRLINGGGVVQGYIYCHSAVSRN